jgi:hypothetical protein
MVRKEAVRMLAGAQAYRGYSASTWWRRLEMLAVKKKY